MSHTRRPNIVLVITDDQGYGDLGCTGNPWLRTPALDDFYADAVRLRDFHVGPTCAPTRAGLLTGHYANSTGVWHTIGGRSLLREGEVTLADALRAAGYRTAIFGKWHLGDNPPYRPGDRGFRRMRNPWRRRHRANAGRLGQRLFRRCVFRQWPAASLRRLLHRRLVC